MRIAIITGASSGMGREFALQISDWEKFDELWVVARRENKLNELKELCPVPVRAVTLDLTEKESFEKYEEMLASEKPDVALLANIAGYGRFGRYDEIPLGDELDMIDLNCKSVVTLTRLTLPYMKRGAKLVFLDSLSAFQPVPYLNVYASTKAFVLSYSRGLGKELKPRGIRVMAISPGWVKTEFFAHAYKTSMSAVTYYNKFYDPEDVIKTALKDLYKTKKDVSVHGFRVRNQVRLVKLLPHSFVMKTWLKQQKHYKMKDED